MPGSHHPAPSHLQHPHAPRQLEPMDSPTPSDQPSLKKRDPLGDFLSFDWLTGVTQSDLLGCGGGCCGNSSDIAMFQRTATPATSGMVQVCCTVP
jgi:hypothetical protein